MSYLDTLKLNNSTFQIPDIDSIGERFRELYGSPLVASTVASMINTEKVYVYTGSETGYTSGHWYYWNGSAWTDGGVYNSSAINTDSTLSIAGMAADAKATGDEIADLRSDLGDLEDLETEDKSSLVNAINEARGSGGSGLTADIKTALLQIAQKVAYIDEYGQDYYDDLYDALYAVTAISLNTNSIQLTSIGATSQLTATTTPAGGNVTWSSSNTSVATVSSTGLVTSVAYGSATITATSGNVSATCSVVVAQATCTGITATYTQSGTVYDSDTLNSLKTDLVVTASWSNGTTSTLADTDYTLSGTLTEGTSTITVSYSGQTATFTVAVSEAPRIPVEYQEVEYIKATGTQYIVTDLDMSDYTLANITADIDFAFDEWQSNYATNIMAAFGSSSAGHWIGYSNNIQKIGMGTASGNYFTTGTVTDRHSYSYSVSGNSCTWTRDDGATISRTKTTEPGEPFELFYHVVGTGTQNDFHFNGKLYSCAVYNSGTAVLDLVPCYRKADNEIGLYDTVNSRFYTNDGTGTFQKGSDVA